MKKLGLTTAAAAGALALNQRLGAQIPALPAPSAAGPHTLAPLPYAADALEPYIDAQTMQIHHGKHHGAYVSNLNRALGEFPDWASKSAEELVRRLGSVPEKIRTAVRNNGGGHVNHTFFWQLLKKNEGGRPSGALAQAIDKQFGSYAKFQEEFTKAAMSVFGSGWAWLTVDRQSGLRIETTPNQDSPLTAGRAPLVALDVWEHAYYLKYQNRRADYVAAFYNLIHWEFAAEQYRQAVG